MKSETPDNVEFFNITLEDSNGMISGTTKVNVFNEAQALAVISSCNNTIKEVLDSLLEKKYGSSPRSYINKDKSFYGGSERTPYDDNDDGSII